MFKKKKINVNDTDTLIGEGSLFEGKINSDASIRVEGQMIGDIECKGDLTVGEKGQLKSNINARNVTIAGSLYGNVNTNGCLTIMETGQLHGNVVCKTIVIAEGGVFQGINKMISKDQPLNEKDALNTKVNNSNVNNKN
jgi:cytoskeletal protein CcmA (bactofilin family)